MVVFVIVGVGECADSAWDCASSILGCVVEDGVRL